MPDPPPNPDTRPLPRGWIARWEPSYAFQTNDGTVTLMRRISFSQHTEVVRDSELPRRAAMRLVPSNSHAQDLCQPESLPRDGVLDSPVGPSAKTAREN